jgi:hypothetical protein
MRAWFLGLVIASDVLHPNLAHADAGGSETDSAAETSANGCEDAGGCVDAPAQAEAAAPVIACDGDLCDTLQGRPSCSTARVVTSAGAFDPGWLAGAVIVSALCLTRRARRGA